MATSVKSSVMMVRIDGTTLRYAFLSHVMDGYEIRGISSLDAANVRGAENRAADNLSVSATVQYLTHVYKDSHFTAEGKKAKPSSESKASLRKRTLYR